MGLGRVGWGKRRGGVGEWGGVGPGALGRPWGGGWGGWGVGGGWLDPWSLLALLIPIGSILYILYYGSSLIYGRGPFFGMSEEPRAQGWGQGSGGIRGTQMSEDPGLRGGTI